MPTFSNEVTGNSESAILGRSKLGRGLEGRAEIDYGVSGDSIKSAGVRGTSVDGRGTEGWSTNSEGVVGLSTKAAGILGQSEEGPGIVGMSTVHYGTTGNSIKSAGVRGTSVEGRGTEGWSTNGEGVVGISKKAAGVSGQSEDGWGVVGISTNNEGMRAETNSTQVAAMAAIQKNETSQSSAFYAEHKGGLLAGHFVGKVLVTGDIQLLNADCAEEFDIVHHDVDAGTVVVLNGDGSVVAGQQPYDKRVAGVISGAGDYRPGLVLDRRETGRLRLPVALLGKVHCKVDAQYGAVQTGDLLTTSPTAGHAMKATDVLRTPGAVIGKALGPLAQGQGLVPILIALQ
ncbi:hypothetical protein [Aquabacterium sp.]|uniref:hypothetical protein n=1 Tax=Aquabacterium sp. TaxID=1872578 RepID=UPI0040382F66